MAATTDLVVLRSGRFTCLICDFMTLGFLMFGAPLEPATMSFNADVILRILAVVVPITRFVARRMRCPHPRENHGEGKEKYTHPAQAKAHFQHSLCTRR